MILLDHAISANAEVKGNDELGFPDFISCGINKKTSIDIDKISAPENGPFDMENRYFFCNTNDNPMKFFFLFFSKVFSPQYNTIRKSSCELSYRSNSHTKIVQFTSFSFMWITEQFLSYHGRKIMPILSVRF